MATHLSSISQALAGNMDAVKIPKPTSFTYYNLGNGHASEAAAVAGAAKGGSPGDLPTPPNSISPTLPAAFRKKTGLYNPGSPPSIDSDIELLDGGDPANDKSEDEGDTADTAHITPQYLAKNHIAGYILDKGPIAVRHVMNHLSETVPGYNKIPSAKARRVTVAALESRAGGGQHGDVEFEKVGWGRWDAKVRGQPSREVRQMYSIREDKSTPPLSDVSEPQPSGALQIPGGPRDRRRSKSRRLSYGSWAGESHLVRSIREDTQDDDFEDVMSMDGDDYNPGKSYRPAPPRKSANPELSSDTEDEDWSAFEPGSYRDSLATSGPGRLSRIISSSGPGGRSRSRGWSPYPSSVPTTHHLNNKHKSSKQELPRIDFTGSNMDLQEQEAITALLTMGAK